MKKITCLLIALCLTVATSAQLMERPPVELKPRIRVIIDNDFGGDPDGLFQLVHHLLSPSVDIRAIIGSHLKAGDGFDASLHTATNAKKHIEDLMDMMHMKGKYPVYAGADTGLENLTTPQPSKAVEAIIREAMREDTDQPLYVVCGGGLTEIASAWLQEPRIAEKLILLWIGGMEYPDRILPPPGYARTEYNTATDIKAVQVVFNQSNLSIWQVPRNTYRQTLVTLAELKQKVAPCGEVGKFLVDKIEFLLNMLGAETYILGDSPLVLLTALQSIFEADTSSSQYELRQSPWINDEGMYEINREGRLIRVYHQLDTRMMFEDLFAKMQQLK